MVTTNNKQHRNSSATRSVTHKMTPTLPKVPQPSASAKVAKGNPARTALNPATSPMDSFLSVYKDHFRCWAVNKRLPFKLKDSLKSFDKAGAEVATVKPFDGTTSYTNDYVPHPVELRTSKPVKAKEEWSRNAQPFGGNTEYCEKFKPWPLPPAFRHIIKGYVPTTGHMESVSTMHADYKAYEYQRIKLAGPLAQQSWQKSMDPFQGTSTMKEDYKIWDVAQRTPFVHKGQLDWPNEVLEKTTTYRTEYTPKCLGHTAGPPQGNSTSNIDLCTCPLYSA